MSALLAIGSLGTPDLILLMILLTVCVAVCLPFSIWVHLRTFFAARRISRQIHIQVSQLQGEQDRRQRKEGIKAARLTAIIIGVVFVCYLPSLIAAIILHAFGYSASNTIASIWVFTLAMANSVFNPLVYVWQMKWFRKVFKKIVLEKSALGENESSNC